MGYFLRKIENLRAISGGRGSRSARRAAAQARKRSLELFVDQDGLIDKLSALMVGPFRLIEEQHVLIDDQSVLLVEQCE